MIMEKDIINTAINALNDGRCDNMEISDIHHEIFNTDYFIIGSYQAEQWLINESETTVFGAIKEIQDYENNNFGETTTDLSEAEYVVNMYTYIRGEELLNRCSTITDNWDSRLSDELKNQLLEELNEML